MPLLITLNGKSKEFPDLNEGASVGDLVSASGLKGDRVAVAYDDPNSVQPTIGIALSKTMGHIFKPGSPISNASELAKQATVELRGDTVRVWWNDYSADPRVSATRMAYRQGIWR